MTKFVIIMISFLSLLWNSALDAESERVVQDALDKVTKGKENE